MAKKKSLGRRKIEMKLIASKSACQVTFSKRKSSLFRKLNELCTLTGCEAAIVVFSPSGKTFSFGHPCIHKTMQKFLCQSPLPAAADLDSHGSAAFSFSQQCSELCKNFVPGKELEQGLKKCQMPCCLDISINELNLDQLLEYKKSVVEVISKIDKQIDELSRPSTTSANGIDLNIPIIK